MVLDFDRRVILPNEDGVANLSEIQFELWSRDRQPPQSLTQDIVSERITVVHKFDSTGTVTEWNWNYENNDISKAFPVDTGVGRHFQRVYQRMNEWLMDKVVLSVIIQIIYYIYNITIYKCKILNYKLKCNGEIIR